MPHDRRSSLQIMRPRNKIIIIEKQKKKNEEETVIVDQIHDLGIGCYYSNFIVSFSLNTKTNKSTDSSHVVGHRFIFLIFFIASNASYEKKKNNQQTNNQSVSTDHGT